MGNGITKDDLDKTYQPKGDYITQGYLKNTYESQLKNFTDAAYQPKGEYVDKKDLQNVVTFKKLPQGINGYYISNSPTYDINKVKGGNTKGNAIISDEDSGQMIFHSLNSNRGTSLSLDKDTFSLMNREQQGFGLRPNGDISISGNNFCFIDGNKNNICLTSDDLKAIKQPVTSTKQPISLAPSRYLRTRNYMHY